MRIQGADGYGERGGAFRVGGPGTKFADPQATNVAEMAISAEGGGAMVVKGGERHRRG